MKKVKVLKYLGENFSYSCEDSVHQTILQRIGLIKHFINELRSIVEDRRAKCLGGINVAFTIWEQAIVPSLIHNSETWGFIPKKSMKLLTNVFNSFYEALFRIDTVTPGPNFWVL